MNAFEGIKHELCYDAVYNFQKQSIAKGNPDKKTFKISDVGIFKIDQDRPNGLLFKNS